MGNSLEMPPSAFGAFLGGCKSPSHNAAFVLEPAAQVLLASPASSLLQDNPGAFPQPEAAPEHPGAATGRAECLSHPPARVWGGGTGTAWFAQSPPCLSFPPAHPALGSGAGASLRNLQVGADPRCGPSGGAEVWACPGLTKPPCSPPQTPQHRTCT